MVDKYSKAYKEVYEMLKCYVKKSELERIPKDELKKIIKKMDKNYNFAIDTQKPFEKQNISKEARAIILLIYRDYFANFNEKSKINELIRYGKRVKGVN